MLFLCYPKCTTCKKAEKWLIENKIEYTKRDIKEENPTAAELEEWHKASELPLKRFFNTSGMVYRENNIKEKLADMNDQQQYELLASDGMLVKRPIFVADDKVVVGFKESEAEAKLMV